MNTNKGQTSEWNDIEEEEIDQYLSSSPLNREDPLLLARGLDLPLFILIFTTLYTVTPMF
jgi:hypothetical protein